MSKGTTSFAVVIPAAGIGSRFGGSLPKQYVAIHGAPIIVRTLRSVLELPGLQRVVVAINPVDTAFGSIIDEYDLAGANLCIVSGGAERANSVRTAMHACMETTADAILVHDAVRPLASPLLFESIVSATIEHGAAIPGIPIFDTIKSVDDKGAVACTVPREALRAIQTPQGFRRDVVAQLLNTDLAGATDEAILAERCGIGVHIVPGEIGNIKITTATDLIVAEALIQAGLGT